MNEQRRDQPQHGQPQQQEHKRDAPGTGRSDQQSAGGHDRMRDEKPKTEQASHQGGGGIRSDHRPQGK